MPVAGKMNNITYNFSGKQNRMAAMAVVSRHYPFVRLKNGSQLLQKQNSNKRVVNILNENSAETVCCFQSCLQGIKPFPRRIKVQNHRNGFFHHKDFLLLQYFFPLPVDDQYGFCTSGGLVGSDYFLDKSLFFIKGQCKFRHAHAP